MTEGTFSRGLLYMTCATTSMQSDQDRHCFGSILITQGYKQYHMMSEELKSYIVSRPVEKSHWISLSQ